MVKCPKCGYKLKFTDISQYCPKCKVNMRFYGFEENFYREAKYAELSQAGILCKIRRLKTAFIGSKMTIARLIVMLLPAAAMLIPAGTAHINLIYKTEDIPLSIMGLVSLFTTGDLSYISAMSGSSVEGSGFIALRNAAFAYTAVALFAVLVLLTSILCFISVKNMQKITCVMAGGGIVSSIVSAVLTGKLVSCAKDSLLISAENGFGIYAVILMFAVVLAVNLNLSVKGIKVEYDEGMLERSEIFKKVKSGKINIDDLPQPVVETAETRKIDEEIAKEEEAYRQRALTGGAVHD